MKLLVAQSCLTLCDHQAPLSTDFSRREYWSGLLFSPPGDLPDPGIKPRSPALQVDSLSKQEMNLTGESYPPSTRR